MRTTKLLTAVLLSAAVSCSGSSYTTRDWVQDANSICNGYLPRFVAASVGGGDNKDGVEAMLRSVVELPLPNDQDLTSLAGTVENALSKQDTGSLIAVFNELGAAECGTALTSA